LIVSDAESVSDTVAAVESHCRVPWSIPVLVVDASVPFGKQLSAVTPLALPALIPVQSFEALVMKLVEPLAAITCTPMYRQKVQEHIVKSARWLLNDDPAVKHHPELSDRAVFPASFEKVQAQIRMMLIGLDRPLAVASVPVLGQKRGPDGLAPLTKCIKEARRASDQFERQLIDAIKE
jgi:hypothetical protein